MRRSGIGEIFLLLRSEEEEEEKVDQAGEEQATQRMRPASLHVMHLRATNSAVKWLRWMDFLEPEQTEQGR